jgi:hypothetical protein
LKKQGFACGVLPGFQERSKGEISPAEANHGQKKSQAADGSLGFKNA